MPSATGTGIDEAVLGKGLIDKLLDRGYRASQLAVSAEFVTLQPFVTNEQAQAA